MSRLLLCTAISQESNIMLSDVYCLPIANTAPFESQQTGSLLPSVVSAAMSVYWGALFACVSLVSSINQQDWRV